MFEKNSEFLYSRVDFERNANIFAELLIEGRMKFANNLQKTINSILRVRKLPNGRIDLNTINELARVSMNSVNMFTSDMNVEDIDDNIEN